MDVIRGFAVPEFGLLEVTEDASGVTFTWPIICPVCGVARCEGHPTGAAKIAYEWHGTVEIEVKE